MSLPFYVVNAFTTSSYAGNPAVVVFTDDLGDLTHLANIAKNFNQPMVAYLRAVPSNDSTPTTATFDVRWVTPSGQEAPVCGHATIASSALLFSTPELLSPSVESITYRAHSGDTLYARREGDWMHIKLPSAVVKPLPSEEVERLTGLFSRASGKDLHVRFIGAGLGDFERYLLVELDVADDLASIKPEAFALRETGYRINIVTSASSDPNRVFVSRMFAPLMGIMEDHVCGSAHCLLTPYWDQKLGKGGEEMAARQVSERGGEIKVRLHASESLITLSGQAKLIMKGEVYLS